jgi:type IV secretion system protein VirB10
MRAAAPPPAQVAQPTAPPQPTAAEKRLADALAAEQKALEAPASPSGWKVAGTTANAQAQPQAPARPIVADDQDDKTDFLKSGQRATRKTVLSASRVAPIGKYVIATGWRIPAALEPMMDSDLPGEVTALVRENVYDTATGRYLLIPQGARLFGAYSSHVSYAQRGAQAVWYRITFPDASSLNLEGMQGHDAQGRAGFRDKVDNHYARLIGTAILTSAFMAGSALAQSRRGSTLAYPSAAETASSAASANMSEQMLEITRRNLNVQPTLQIRSGYPFDVMVNRDMAFDGPYAALPMR